MPDPLVIPIAAVHWTAYLTAFAAGGGVVAAIFISAVQLWTNNRNARRQEDAAAAALVLQRIPMMKGLLGFATEKVNLYREMLRIARERHAQVGAVRDLKADLATLKIDQSDPISDSRNLFDDVRRCGNAVVEAAKSLEDSVMIHVDQDALIEEAEAQLRKVRELRNEHLDDFNTYCLVARKYTARFVREYSKDDPEGPNP